MNASLATQEPRNEESVISTDNPANDNDDELSEEDEQESKVILDFNYTLEIQLNPYPTMKKFIMKKIKNASTIPPDERDDETSVSNNSPKLSASIRHHEGTLDEETYTITAAGHTMPSSSLQITSIDGFFNRKRGRPPKNRFVEVYKNTFQKPQAIFTSFKLEKPGQADLTAYQENSFDNCLQNSVEVSRSFDNDMDHAIECSRQNPTYECSTKRKHLSRVDTVIITPKDSSGKTNDEDNNSNYFYSNKSYDLSNATQNKTCENHDISFDSGPEHKKPKLCKTAENVTVVRAAGTFYPESSNSNGISNCKNCINNTKTFADTVKKEQSIFSCEMEVPQNLSLKTTRQINSTDCLRDAKTPSIAECPKAVLPQNYNVLQMQRQLFTFYQQLAFMTTAFSYLNLETFLAPTVDSTNLTTDTSSTSSSTTPATGSEMNLLHNNHLLSIILNLHKQLNSCSELATGKGADSCIRQLLKKATTTKDDKRSQNTATPIDVSAEADPKVPKSQFQYGSECAPTGYIRYRVKEDCGYEKCGYRQHQSHFHCNRAGCQYSFCDRSRFLQHTARHERLDAIMGSDFEQYRVKMNCNYTNCPYSFKAANGLNEIFHSRKSSHFHCLKCPFVCADSNKVVAHRRLHSKMEFIRLSGFRKVTAHENCMISNNSFELNKDQQYMNNVMSPDNMSGSTLQHFNATCNHQPPFDNVWHCPYAMRYAHYHCLVCNCFVLSKSQLLSHKHRNPLVSHNASDALEAAKLSP